VVDDAVGFVDVVDGAITQAADGRIVFFAGNVVVSFVEQFEGAMKAASAIHVSVDWRVIVEALAVVNRGVLDFPNRFIDLVDGVLFFPVHMFSGCKLTQMSAGMAQIGERMQIGRMTTWLVGKAESGTQGKYKNHYGTMSNGLHGFLGL
jgi:hypothetical protein